MSHYTFQFIVLSIGFALLALWFSSNRNRPARIRNGFHIVCWSFSLRLLSATFLIAMLTACIYFLSVELATDEQGTAVLWFLVIRLLAFDVLAALTFRARNEYNETILIAHSMFGNPRQYILSDFTSAGPISWRGNKFSTEAGDKIYVNTYQTGAADLIGLLQRQVRQTYSE